MCILMAVTSCTVVAQFVVSIAQCNESRDRYWTIVVHSYNDIMGINHSNAVIMCVMCHQE